MFIFDYRSQVLTTIFDISRVFLCAGQESAVIFSPRLRDYGQKWLTKQTFFGFYSRNEYLPVVKSSSSRLKVDIQRGFSTWETRNFLILTTGRCPYEGKIPKKICFCKQFLTIFPEKITADSCSVHRKTLEMLKISSKIDFYSQLSTF